MKMMMMMMMMMMVMLVIIIISEFATIVLAIYLTIDYIGICKKHCSGLPTAIS